MTTASPRQGRRRRHPGRSPAIRRSPTVGSGQGQAAVDAIRDVGETSASQPRCSNIELGSSSTPPVRRIRTFLVVLTAVERPENTSRGGAVRRRHHRLRPQRDAYGLPRPNLRGDRKEPFFTGNSFFNRGWVIAPASTSGVDGLVPRSTRRVQRLPPARRPGSPAGPGGKSVSILFRISGPAMTASPSTHRLRREITARPSPRRVEATAHVTGRGPAPTRAAPRSRCASRP